MADLKRRSDRTSDLRRPSGDRGQLIVIGAVLLAITFVALALILNSVIFTENLATRSESLGNSGPVGIQNSLSVNVGTLLRYVNVHNDTDSGALNTSLKSELDDTGTIMRKQYAMSGQLVNVSFEGSTGGTRLWHNNSTQVFDASDGASDWDLATDITDIRAFTLTVNRSGLAEADECPFEQCFRANVTDGTDTWGIGVYRDGNAVNVTSFDQTGVIGTCSVSDEQAVTIDVTGGWVGDERCQAIQFGQGVDLTGKFTLNYTNGDRANGTYSVVVRKDSGGLSLPVNLFDDPSSSSDPPFATPALYSVTVRTVYNTDRITYNSTLRVAPGEPR